MYTIDDYQVDLEILQSFKGSNIKKKEKKYITVEHNYSFKENFVKIDKGEYLAEQTVGFDTYKKTKDYQRITASNFPLLKRSEFDLKKFKTSLKLEKSLDADDDYFAPFISLWTQLENEYKIRLYEPFVPDNISIILDVLDRSDQLANNCLEDVVRNNKPVTFGLINEVFFAIEIGFKNGEIEIERILARIFLNGGYDRFFSRYSIYKCFKKLNKVIRNAGLHENKFIPHQLYNEACKTIFMKPLINDWCNSVESCFFTDYLKLLPETTDEIRISCLEKKIQRSKEQESIDSGEAQLENLQRELEALRKTISQI